MLADNLLMKLIHSACNHTVESVPCNQAIYIIMKKEGEDKTIYAWIIQIEQLLLLCHVITSQKRNIPQCTHLWGGHDKR